MQKTRTIYITEYDFERLQEMLRTARHSGYTQDCVEKLKEEIERARIVSSEKIPGDLVTMNSRIVLEDEQTYQEFTFQVVFPSDSDVDAGKISILAPVGRALLGYKVGDTVEWKAPRGMRRLKIIKMLYQPESEGDLYQ